MPSCAGFIGRDSSFIARKSDDAFAGSTSPPAIKSLSKQFVSLAASVTDFCFALPLSPRNSATNSRTVRALPPLRSCVRYAPIKERNLSRSYQCGDVRSLGSHLLTSPPVAYHSDKSSPVFSLKVA